LNNPIVCEVSNPFGDSLPTAFHADAVSLISDSRFRLSDITRSSNGQVSLKIFGPAGTFELQRSTNLSEWQLLQRLTNTTGQVDYLDATGSDAAQHFYRAVSE